MSKNEFEAASPAGAASRLQQAQKYFRSGITRERCGAKRFILTTSVSSDPGLRGELPATSAEIFPVGHCTGAVWSAAIYLTTSISSEPGWRGELPATSAEIFPVGHYTGAVWSEAT